MRHILILLLFCSIGYGQGVVPNPFVLYAASALYDGANAADPENEVNGVANIDARTLTSVASSATSPQDGSYSVVVTHTGGTNELANAYFEFNLENGSNYTVTFYAKEITGTNAQAFLRTTEGWVAQDGTAITAVGTWVEYSLTGTTNSTTPTLRIGTTSNGDGGDEIGVDNIRIVKN